MAQNDAGSSDFSPSTASMAKAFMFRGIITLSYNTI